MLSTRDPAFLGAMCLEWACFSDVVRSDGEHSAYTEWKSREEGGLRPSSLELLPLVTRSFSWILWLSSLFGPVCLSVGGRPFSYVMSGEPALAKPSAGTGHVRGIPWGSRQSRPSWS